MSHESTFDRIAVVEERKTKADTGFVRSTLHSIVELDVRKISTIGRFRLLVFLPRPGLCTTNNKDAFFVLPAGWDIKTIPPSTDLSHDYKPQYNSRSISTLLTHN